MREFVDSQLAEKYTPLLAGALDYQADALGLKGRDVLEPVVDQQRYGETLRYGEIFPSAHGLVTLELADREPRYRRDSAGRVVLDEEEGSTVTLYGMGSMQVRDPLREIAQLLSERFDLELEENSYRNEKFEKLKEEGRSSPERPSDEEEASARLLSQDLIRQAAIGIASSGGLLTQDLPKHLGDAAADSAKIEQQLKESSLVDIDLVVTCKSKSTQVARVPSREALDQMANSGLKCACGRNVLDERIDEALTLTEHGRKMLNGSYWMTVLVIAELLDLDIKLDQMLVEQVSGGDEMDFFVDVSGDLVLMELKDKEFNLGNAYSFGSKTGIFQPRYPIIVTSSYVGNDAKDHFEQAASARQSANRFGEAESGTADIEYIEGLVNLRSRLEQLVERVFEQDVSTVLSRILPYAAASGPSLVAGLKERAAEGDGSRSESDEEQAADSADPSMESIDAQNISA